MKLRHIVHLAASAALMASFATTAWADPDKDESGHGKERKRERKEEYWDGNCKVERKWEKNGDYKEERKCEGKGKHRHGHRHDHHRPALPAPVVVYPPWVVVEQGRPDYRPGYEPAPVQVPAHRCNSQTVGQVLGGIAGGALGSQVGKGSGRAVATVGGAVIGVLVGGEIGRRMDADNQACIGQALEFAPAGHRVTWPGPSGGQYAVVPGQVIQRDGVYCRPYEAHVQTGTGWERIQGTACRRPDGAWVAAAN